MYGFDGEVKSKYTAQMAELFTEVYNWLPLAHCLNNKVLVRSCPSFNHLNFVGFCKLGDAWWFIFERRCHPRRY